MCLVCLLNEGIHAEGDEPTAHQRLVNSLPCEFAGHRLIREIANGGMGIVFEAEDPKLKRCVALKVIREVQFARREDAARFRAEMKAIARLVHPHIIPVYESGEVDGVPYFTMRLAEGGSLAEHLQKHGAMEPGAAAAMMVSIARAVQHAHDRGVLHRDLKPANILLDSAGSPLLADFGLAKQLDAEAHLTRSGSQLGTLHYMSPEQASGGALEVTTASDVWALGVLLCQMLTNKLPFAGSSVVEVIRSITEDEPDLGSRPSKDGLAGRATASVVSRLPADLATLIRRCLEKHPQKRLRSAGFLADELERFMAGEVIESRPVTGIDLIWRRMLRHKVASVALIVAVFSLLMGTVVSIRQAMKAREALKVAQQRQREADAISEMTMNTLMGLRTRSSRGRVVNRAEAVEALLERVRQFNGDPLRKARLLTDVAAMTSQETTLQCYREAERLASSALSEDEPRLWRFRFLAASQWCIIDEESEEALGSLRAVLEWQRQHQGAENMDTIITLFALGKALSIHGRPEEAVPLLEEACRLAEKKQFKPFNLMNYRFYHLIAMHGSGRREQALSLGRKYVEEAKQRLGTEHVLTGEILALHASHSQAGGLLAEAKECGTEALDILWKTAGPENIDAVECLSLMLALLRQQEGPVACLALQKEALRVADQWHGPLHSLTAAHAAACVDLLREINRADEARTFAAAWLERMRDSSGAIPPEAKPLIEA
ncbi:MAG: serine/threonine-protein kinase, partial [Prosthecobacter sp.]|nr:serine/threonine-protein kinase [Prosthecobacter sp.]